MSDGQKLCKDCRHYVLQDGPYSDRCLKGTRTDSTAALIRGIDALPPYNCWDMRESDQKCGPDARWFEPRQS